jgi:hypothetical protein
VYFLRRRLLEHDIVREPLAKTPQEKKNGGLLHFLHKWALSPPVGIGQTCPRTPRGCGEGYASSFNFFGAFTIIICSCPDIFVRPVMFCSRSDFRVVVYSSESTGSAAVLQMHTAVSHQKYIGYAHCEPVHEECLL